MMKKFIYGITLAMFLLTACSKDDEVKPKGSENLSGDIVTNVTLDAEVEYLLNGTLRVKSGGKLTIPAGTVIKAQKGFSSYLLVEQGGQIFAEGTAANPIVFTSAEAQPKVQDWGGIIINGYAPISGATAGTTSKTEVDNNFFYGGNNVSDNSGVLKYVMIKYTGARSSSSVEHNGLTLNGVGNGTVIENIYVFECADDGIEFFGGSVNVTNLLVVNSDDDMFDFTQGYTGTLANAYGIWEAGFTSTEEDPRGVEADGNLDGNGPDHIGQSNFTINGMTIVNNSTFEMQDVIKVRRGAKATITNALVKNGSATDLSDFTDSKGAGDATSSISVTSANVTVTGSETKGTANITVNPTPANTGANTSVFSWTGYTFPN